ncbi:hypothetical protein NEF87_002033 [Candidatus Lokiarchaeum ossiferum]|uniref:GTP-binding protein n=1 Tax=Candidatus Lokiarchaeum ossiferum TaxID=2951803 RepID=A0ABY6HQG9_9ARCH|nr:hypothetical protein NEF87_002033 [Candidatus Lokiarchaeum sp. B-35]
MVTIADGRFSLPDNLLYTKNQHVYLNNDKKTLGLDEIGYAFLHNPNELKILVEDEVKIGIPFAAITTDSGMTTLNSPCSGKIKQLNPNALASMKDHTYETGFIIELEEITEVQPNLVTGSELQEWGNNEVKTLVRNNYSFKIIEIGDSAVGKTAIKVRFTDNYFKKDLKTTLGVDFGSKEIKGEYISSDILFSGTYRFTAKMNVWDAAGQAMYDKIRGMYYRDAKGALMCYDVHNHLSFEHLEKWREELEESLGKVPVLLVGNKIDLERKVTRQEGLAYAMKHNYLFVECSAKTGEGVDDMFKQLAVEIFKREEKLE